LLRWNPNNDPIARQNAANRLIYDLLVEPTEHQNLSNNLEDRIAVEQYQMTVYTHGNLRQNSVNG